MRCWQPGCAVTRVAADVFKSRQFTSGFEDGALDVQPPWTARFKRYVELQRKWDREEVAVFIAPIGS